jgi:hypothetical protein
MEKSIEIYTLEDARKLHTRELIPILADGSNFPAEVRMIAKQVINMRIQSSQTTFDQVQGELSSDRVVGNPNYEMLVREELLRRKDAERKKESVEKHDGTIQVRGKRGSFKLATETLMQADKNDSIFKIKQQWSNTRFINTYYSRDFSSERRWFEGEKLEMVKATLENGSKEHFELFDKGGLREGGFNGFTWNVKNTESIQSGLCWFAIYLNNITQQQPNGEFWSMEVLSFGKKLPPLEKIQNQES